LKVVLAGTTNFDHFHRTGLAGSAAGLGLSGEVGCIHEGREGITQTRSSQFDSPLPRGRVGQQSLF
jgi:hypothetical protein